MLDLAHNPQAYIARSSSLHSECLRQEDGEQQESLAYTSVKLLVDSIWQNIVKSDRLIFCDNGVHLRIIYLSICAVSLGLGYHVVLFYFCCLFLLFSECLMFVLVLGTPIM